MNKRKKCVECSSEKVSRKDFEDKSCYKEFALTGLCQKCQNDRDQSLDDFGVPDDPFASTLDWDDEHYNLIIEGANYERLSRR